MIMSQLNFLLHRPKRKMRQKLTQVIHYYIVFHITLKQMR